jgi:hypothetical protein
VARILFLDADDDSRDDLAAALARRGHEVRRLDSAEAGQELLDRPEAPDVEAILLVILMSTARRDRGVLRTAARGPFGCVVRPAGGDAFLGELEPVIGDPPEVTRRPSQGPGFLLTLLRALSAPGV